MLGEIYISTLKIFIHSVAYDGGIGSTYQLFSKKQQHWTLFELLEAEKVNTFQKQEFGPESETGG